MEIDEIPQTKKKIACFQCDQLKNTTQHVDVRGVPTTKSTGAEESLSLGGAPAMPIRIGQTKTYQTPRIPPFRQARSLKNKSSLYEM